MTKGVARVARIAVAAALVVTSARSARAQVASPAPPALAVGDWQVAPVAEVRVRGEYRYDLDGRDVGALLERTRLGADAHDGPVEARVVLQDARDLPVGDGPNPIAGPAPVSYLGAYEAWVDAHTDSLDASYLRVGRQPVVWGEGRLLGESDWSPTGRSLDAVRGRLAFGDGAAELLGALLVDPATPDSLHDYGELAGARFEWAFDPLLAIDAHVLVRVAQDDPIANLDGSVRGHTETGVLRVHGQGRGWTYGVEGAYQMGHADGPGLDRSAFAGAGHVAYQLEDVVWQPTLGASASYASGARGGSTFTRFDPLLPDVHGGMGVMDLVAWSNEAEAGGDAKAAPWKDGEAALGYRYFALAQASDIWTTGYLTTIGSTSGGGAASLGHEIDATARWSPWAPVDLTGGYSLFLLSSGARTLLADSGIGPIDLASHAVRVPSVVHFAYAGVRLTLP